MDTFENYIKILQQDNKEIPDFLYDLLKESYNLNPEQFKDKFLKSYKLDLIPIEDIDYNKLKKINI